MIVTSHRRIALVVEEVDVRVLDVIVPKVTWPEELEVVPEIELADVVKVFSEVVPGLETTMVVPGNVKVVSGKFDE